MDQLEALRAEIDAVDAALHDLLLRRLELAQRARMSAAAARIRPAQEAQILRKLTARKGGIVPLPALARIFREILSAPSPVEVHILAPDDPVPVIELARAHFGALASLIRAASAAIVLERVRTVPGAIGLLPVPGASAEKWWLRLLSEVAGVPRVIARLPAYELHSADATTARAFVVAAAQPEPSGEDHTLLAVEAAAATPGGLERALSGCGLKVHLLDRASERAQGFFLFEAEGFVNATDLPEKPLAPIERIHLIGSYPVPLVWPRGEGASIVALRGTR